MAWRDKKPVEQPLPDSYYQALTAFPLQVQFLVLESRDLERTNPKAARKWLFQHPEVVAARKQAAQAIMATKGGM